MRSLSPPPCTLPSHFLSFHVTIPDPRMFTCTESRHTSLVLPVQVRGHNQSLDLRRTSISWSRWNACLATDVGTFNLTLSLHTKIDIYVNICYLYIYIHTSPSLSLTLSRCSLSARPFNVGFKNHCKTMGSLHSTPLRSRIASATPKVRVG